MIAMEVCIRVIEVDTVPVVSLHVGGLYVGLIVLFLIGAIVAIVSVAIIIAGQFLKNDKVIQVGIVDKGNVDRARGFDSSREHSAVLLT